jgi:hypothetical protein
MATTEKSARPEEAPRAPSPSHTRLSSSAMVSRMKTTSQVNAPAIAATRSTTKALGTAGMPMKYRSASACGLSRSSSCSAR